MKPLRLLLLLKTQWKRSIRTRIWLAALLCIAAVSVVATSNSSIMEKTAALPLEIHEKPYQVGLAVRDLRADVEVMHAELSNLSRSPSRLALRRFEQRMLPIDKRAETFRTTISKRFVGDRSLVESAFQSHRDWNQMRGEVVAAIRANDQITAYTLMKTEGYTQVKYLHERLNQLAIASDQYSQGLYESAGAYLRQSQSQSRVAMFLALLFVCGAVAMISIVVVQPVREISDALQRISNGNLNTVIPHHTRADEIGQVARSSQIFLSHAINIRQSNIDLLTSLPKRRQLIDFISIRQLDPDCQEQDAFLLHLDIDGFVQINDILGRDVGDQVLQCLAARMREFSRKDDFVVREGADSFVWYRANGGGVDDAVRFAKTLQSVLGRPIEIEDHTIRVDCSIGIAISDDQLPAGTLLIRAESARKEAKRQGNQSISVYTNEMDARLLRRRETLRGLRFALDHNEIVPFFQPQVDANTGELSGFECLVRWTHPEHGTMSPWQFLAVAQGAGLLGAITETMIRQSLAQLARWRKQGFNVPRISLNLDASDLGRDGFADRLMLEVDRHGLGPGDVCLELLESAMIEDGENLVSRTLNRLGQLGFPIELDDFGTGHAAIASLRLISLKGIKIDRSFVTRLHERPGQIKLTKAMLHLANAMQIQTVAEGVESTRERDLMIELGCDVLQGYGIARPMSGEDATLWLGQFTPDIGRMEEFRKIA